MKEDVLNILLEHYYIRVKNDIQYVKEGYSLNNYYIIEYTLYSSQKIFITRLLLKYVKMFLLIVMKKIKNCIIYLINIWKRIKCHY